MKRPRSKEAERQRRYRERQRRGDVVIPPLSISPAVLENLIEGGFLHAWDADNPAAVAEAVETLLLKTRPFYRT